jgi:hypothetical protein
MPLFSDRDSSRVSTKYKSSALFLRQLLYILIALELFLTKLEAAAILVNGFGYGATV